MQQYDAGTWRQSGFIESKNIKSFEGVFQLYQIIETFNLLKAEDR